MVRAVPSCSALIWTATPFGAMGNRGYAGGEDFIRSNSVGNYGPKRSVPRLLELLDRYQLPATFFVPAKVMEDHPALLREIDQAGHEIGPSVRP